MLKDVKKSLILWPLTASVIVMLLSWLGSNNESFIQWVAQTKQSITLAFGDEAIEITPIAEETVRIDHWDLVRGSSTLKTSVAVMHRQVSPPKQSTVAVERPEHGSRALRVPDRLEREIGGNPSADHVRPIVSVPAPVRNETQELAGHQSAPSLTLPTLQPQMPLTITPIGTSMSLTNATESNTHDSILPKSISVLGKRIVRTKPDIKKDETNVYLETYAPPSAVDSYGESLAQRPVQSLAQPPAQPPVEPTAGTYEPTHRSPQFSPAGWPVTSKLDQQLNGLEQFATGTDAHTFETTTMVNWIHRVQATLDQLRRLPRLGHPDAGEKLDQLKRLFVEGHVAAEAMPDREAQILWLHACYAVERRAAVWKPVWNLTSSGQTEQVLGQIDPQTLLQAEQYVAQVREILPETQDVEGWNRYLLLDELERSANEFETNNRAMLAKRFLSRLRWHGLHPEHRDWLDNDAIEQLANAVRPWTRGAVDYASLLNQIEHQEANEIDTVSVEIAEAVQTLQHAESPQAVEIANVIDTYYRNANIRVAMSEGLLERMLPSMDTKTVPVRTTILGSQVTGVSQVDSSLQIQLKPTPDRWQIELQTLGNVHTRSLGTQGPVSVRTDGDSNFFATTPIEISTNGIRKGESWVDVQGSTRLRGIESDYDRWPLLGPLVRSIAHSRYDSQKPVTNRLASAKLREQVSSEIDEQVQTKLNQSTDQLAQVVLGPLGALRLDPKVVDMQTTSERLLARYRLAGDWQIAAFTPRPRALRDSLMSVQVHQSAMNNMLEQLVPRDQPLLISDMINQGALLFGQDPSTLPEDIPDDVMIQFAKTRPITVEIEDNKMWLTLRIVRLTRGDTLDLRRFIVRGAYVPHAEGLKASLVRDGHLRISGPSLSMRQRLPIRAIFNKVLSTTHGFPLTAVALEHHPAASNLVISQLELREGWMAMAVSEAEAARIATRP
ncbi:hypothetical protein CA13_49470 [Planctomycetes bacterium CA13]|uniref:Uncharacterized protein n=1 Tax=Novipirellula herctigrandis TaxID=2527986 RepID=A0A5C5Z858_9BACT|nr:hypothetical protein CA13_49470 [Planctomycetes bacterium CA13]